MQADSAAFCHIHDSDDDGEEDVATAGHAFSEHLITTQGVDCCVARADHYIVISAPTGRVLRTARLSPSAAVAAAVCGRHTSGGTLHPNELACDPQYATPVDDSERRHYCASTSRAEEERVHLARARSSPKGGATTDPSCSHHRRLTLSSQETASTRRAVQQTSRAQPVFLTSNVCTFETLSPRSVRSPRVHRRVRRSVARIRNEAL